MTRAIVHLANGFKDLVDIAPRKSKSRLGAIEILDRLYQEGHDTEMIRNDFEMICDDINKSVKIESKKRVPA